MTIVDNLTLIFSILIIIKMLAFLIINPKKILKIGENLYKNKIMGSSIVIILIGLLSYPLLKEITLSQFFIASIIGMYIYALCIIQYPKEMLNFWNKSIGKNVKPMIIIFLIYGLIGLYAYYSSMLY